MRKSCKRNEKIRKERESRVIAIPEMDEDHLVVCVNHPQAEMLKRIFQSTDLFQNIYDWVGSLYHLPEYFELSNVTGEIILPSESISKAEKCVLYMQERDALYHFMRMIPKSNLQIKHQSGSNYIKK